MHIKTFINLIHTRILDITQKNWSEADIFFTFLTITNPFLQAKGWGLAKSSDILL